MAKVVNVRLVDHSDEVIRALESQVEAALEAVGQQCVSHAKSNITSAGRVDTGALRNSMTHQVVLSEKAVYVGTNSEYAIYNEFGTGIHAEGGKGRQTPWTYQDAKGNFHRTRGMKPIHFLKNAAADHVDEYRSIVKNYLSD
jgi:HK97 gp10 family phage protein